MKKFDVALVVESFGVGLATAGLAFVSVPLAMIALGVFLVWATESGK